MPAGGKNTNSRPLDMSDWSLPSDHDEVDERIDWVGTHKLIVVAKENGVRVDGSVKQAIETFKDYWIETNNRAVLHAYERHDLSALRQARSDADRFGRTLPPRDIGSLDPDNLEIVKTELPKKEWFVLNLRNRSSPSEGAHDQER
jgi:hypothetical protein